MLDSMMSTKPTVALYRPVRFVKESSTFRCVGILHLFEKFFFQNFCIHNLNLADSNQIYPITDPSVLKSPVDPAVEN